MLGTVVVIMQRKSSLNVALEAVNGAEESSSTLKVSKMVLREWGRIVDRFSGKNREMV